MGISTLRNIRQFGSKSQDCRSVSKSPVVDEHAADLKGSRHHCDRPRLRWRHRVARLSTGGSGSNLVIERAEYSQ